MSTSIKNGINWSLEGKKIDFFGAKGMPIGQSWAINVFGGLMAEVDKVELSSEINEIIADDRRNGNEEKISYVGVGPRQAVCLFLEGVITPDALEGAEETLEAISLNAVLGGKVRKLVIRKDFPCTIATYDRQGNIV